MNSGFKHFTHAHNLVMHQAYEAAKMSCSGCNSLVNGTAYVCWQCNFVLHEQCFHANRSLNHPSHPEHPLSLVPYPTYPSNSFYCNFCKLIGTGLSYSCSDCEFDLHVHCTQSGTHQQMVSQNVHVPVNGQTQYTHSPNTNLQYSSAGSNTQVGESGSFTDSDEEHIKRNEQRLKIASEMYRLEAIGRQNALDLI